MQTNTAEFGVQLMTESEGKDPVHVFTSFFESFDFLDVREQLAEALALVVEKHFRHRAYSIEEDNVRFFFEKLEQVMEAAWLMKS